MSAQSFSCWFHEAEMKDTLCGTSATVFVGISSSDAASEECKDIKSE